MRIHRLCEIAVYAVSGVCGAGVLKVVLGPTCRVTAAADDNVDEQTNTQTTRTSRLKPILVQVLFRHGARTPIHNTPKIAQATYDPAFLLNPVGHTLFAHKVLDVNGGPKPISTYDLRNSKHKLKGGCTIGQLTSLGQDQLYMLGQQLRSRYVDQLHLLAEDYNPTQVHLRSTNTQRTRESARCVLAGMFGRDHLNSLPEKPVIYVRDGVEDPLVPRPSICPTLRKVNHAAMIHGGDNPHIQKDRIKLEKVLGVDLSKNEKKINFVDVRDDLIARMTHGMPVPQHLVPHLDMIKRNAVTLMYYAFCGQHDAERNVSIRLSTGPLLQMITDNIKSHTENSPKLFLYSCHDSTLIGLLGALDIYEQEWPPFGVDLRFELYEDEDESLWIKVIYNGEAVIVRDCGTEICPLDVFLKAMSPYCITDDEYYEECHSSILERIAKELLAQEEEGEVEDEDSKERSDTAAGM